VRTGIIANQQINAGATSSYDVYKMDPNLIILAGFLTWLFLHIIGFIIISSARKRYYRKYLLVQNTCLWVEGLKAIDEKSMEKFSEMMHKDYETAIKKTKDIQATEQPLISIHYLFDYLLFAKKTLKDILLNSENIMKKYYQSLRIITFKRNGK
jgi:hypothetical protein